MHKMGLQQVLVMLATAAAAAAGQHWTAQKSRCCHDNLEKTNTAAWTMHDDGSRSRDGTLRSSLQSCS
jgi:hypothetical protein